MQCIESILNQLTEQILILAASLTLRGHEAGLFLAFDKSFPVVYRLCFEWDHPSLAPFLFAWFEFSWDSVLANYRELPCKSLKIIL